MLQNRSVETRQSQSVSKMTVPSTPGSAGAVAHADPSHPSVGLWVSFHEEN